MICASGSGHESCQGDRGGPLISLEVRIKFFFIPSMQMKKIQTIKRSFIFFRTINTFHLLVLCHGDTVVEGQMLPVYFPGEYCQKHKYLKW